MTDFTSPIIGTITLQPRLAMDEGRLAALADDSTLGSLLKSLAHCPSLADAEPAPPRLVASTRLCRLAASDDVACGSIRADLARLVEDLECEYERLVVA